MADVAFKEERLRDDHRAQVHNYLKATAHKLGLLVNFTPKSNGLMVRSFSSILCISWSARANPQSDSFQIQEFACIQNRLAEFG